MAVSRKTMSDWVRAIAPDWLGLIYESIKSDVRRSAYLHIDETPVACMDPDTRGRARNGYLWAYLADFLSRLPTCSSHPDAIRALQPKHWNPRQDSP